MKRRDGFVSNSSSASFVIYWRVLADEEIDLEDFFKEICEYSDYDPDVLANHTEKVASDNTFKTKMHTTMYNTVQDFGPEVAYFMMTAHLTPSIEIIDTQINEGGW